MLNRDRDAERGAKLHLLFLALSPRGFPSGKRQKGHLLAVSGLSGAHVGDD